jgi:integrase
MDSLVLWNPTEVSGTVSHAEIEQTMSYAEAEKAPATREAYASDWKDFCRWCTPRGLVPLPALPGSVALYLSHLASQGRKASTISRRCAAIADRHRQAGIDQPPTTSAGVRAVLKGIRRTIGTAVVQKHAATADIVRRMMDTCPDTMIRLSDRALISFALASAMRRSELCDLDVADLVETADGYRVIIRRSKTDQTGEGQEIAVPRGLKLCPVTNLQAWMTATDITDGKVFRAVLRGGRVQASLTPECLNRVIKKLAARIGMDPKTVAGHSTRAGFTTSCIEAGAPIVKVAEQTRHRTLSMLLIYSRRLDLFKDHTSASWI